MISGYLINPVISNKTIKSSNDDIDTIIKDIWKELSTLIKGGADQFYISIEFNDNDQKTFIKHYKITEKIENNNAKFSVEEITIPAENEKKFIDYINNLNKKDEPQHGGKHKHRHKHKLSSSSSTSSSSSSLSSSSSDTSIDEKQTTYVFNKNKNRHITYTYVKPRPILYTNKYDYSIDLYDIYDDVIVIPHFVSTYKTVVVSPRFFSLLP
jgi:hypothetical protein